MSESEKYLEFLQEKIAQGKVAVSNAKNLEPQQIESIEKLRSIKLEDIVRRGVITINGKQIVLKYAGQQVLNSRGQIEVSIGAEGIRHLHQYMQTATLYDGLVRARIPITGIFAREFYHEPTGV